MSRYKCVKCGREIDELPIGPIRCPSCSFRVIEKVRPEVVSEIKAE